MNSKFDAELEPSSPIQNRDPYLSTANLPNDYYELRVICDVFKKDDRVRVTNPAGTVIGEKIVLLPGGIEFGAVNFVLHKERVYAVKLLRGKQELRRKLVKFNPKLGQAQMNVYF